MGAALGTLVAGSAADIFGRKKAIILSDIFLFCGPLILWMAGSIFQLYIGRFLIGLGFGINLLVCSIYLSEASPTEIRGSITGIYHFAALSGIILSTTSGIVFEGDWAFMFALASIPACG